MRSIQVLGPGCPKCWKLRDNAAAAVERLRVEATVEQITDIDAIIAFDVLLTPALVIDGRVQVVGRVPSVEEIERLLAP